MEISDKKGSLALAVIKFTAAVLILVFVCYAAWRTAMFMARKGKSVPLGTEASAKNLPVIVIDPGHGGMDSGAVGVDGSLEKELNLSVAERLCGLFELSGFECVMTRDSDRMLVDDGIKEHRKMHDLKNRLAVAGEFVDAGRDVIFISIHMNKYTSPEYSGLQVWYSPSDGDSEELARYIQSYASTWLDSSNRRQIKKATSSIYVLDHAQMPAVLVECGFLSNPEECEKLGNEAYQTQTALVIYSAVCSALR